ncbi:hypothetical protein EDD18DRAFT_1310725 [Armillaria luteobubalina]|uniref:glucan endo-1,3-beta-D-glucosidase n=1 Tax=Armillaria luteobubalina TaxID=153913 RepID=A0AA39PZ20_9AGAR|nr:hypothetical protein EDD18DRAFT_1310725 [Armillaria luteobubalina]
MPATLPSTTNNWWCDMNTEYAFVGFSYEVTACQDFNQLQSEFADIRKTFNGRYVRIYGACDREGFYDDVINAAWNAGVGIHALIWFGFDGGDIWQTRRDALFATLQSNSKAKFITRVVQFGSEPLYDNALTHEDLTAQLIAAKGRLSNLGIPVTISELAYGYQAQNGAKDVLAAVDIQASAAGTSWPLVVNDLNWFTANASGKKIYLSQNGWPSVTYQGVMPNSANAVADVQNESVSSLLSNASSPGGGVGWFAHIYSDAQEPGYGIYDDGGTLKFPFGPLTFC